MRFDRSVKGERNVSFDIPFVSFDIPLPKGDLGVTAAEAIFIDTAGLLVYTRSSSDVVIGPR